MFLKSVFLSTLAVAGLVAGDNACQAKTNNIGSSADLDALSSCQTLEGPLIIGEDITTVKLPKLQQIKGDFIVEGASNLASINMPALRIINGEFRLKQLTVLDTLSCPELKKVGSITWITLPKLMSLSFDSKVTEADSVRISDTQLTSLTGIDLKTVRMFNIDNNKYLKDVSFGLTNVTESLSLEFNLKTLSISFPKLIWANNITIISAGSIDLPMLQHVNGSANFGNNSFTAIECKNLTIVEQTLAFSGNPKLTKLNFPLLTEIGGGFKIHNNSALVTIDGFPELKTVRGAIDFVGNFQNATLPNLEDVQGGFNLQTTENFDCTEFKKYNDDKVIKGDDFVCKGNEQNPETKDGKSGKDKTGNNNDNNSGATGRVEISALFGLSAAMIAFSL